jgi:hypothetical protein
LLCTRPTCLDGFFYSASSLKQQSTERHAPLWHIILILSQPVFALSPKCCMLSGEATNTNFIVFILTRSRLEPTIYHTRGQHANHYTTDVVCWYTHQPFNNIINGDKILLSRFFFLLNFCKHIFITKLIYMCIFP